MNDNTLNTAAITIVSAGARMREIEPRIRHLEQLSWDAVDAATRAEARRSAATLQIEADALRDYVTSCPGDSAEDGTVQIDAILLPFEGMATDPDVPEHYRKLLGQSLEAFASLAGILSNISGQGLDIFTVSCLDDTYSLAFPLAARSAFAAADLV